LTATDAIPVEGGISVGEPVRSTTTIVVIITAVGAALRLAQYLGRPSLRLDEARLALNVATRSWAGLLRPLDYDQTAPPIFLWLEKAAIQIGGVNELAFRLPTLLAGILCIPLLYIVARRIASPRAALIAAAIAAASPLLVQYSVESKPYALDMLVGLVLLALALDWNKAPGSARAAARMAVAGAVAVWASTPAIFVLASVLVVLAFGDSATRPERPRLAMTAGLWAASFVASNPYMQQYWSESLLTPWRRNAAWRAWQGARDVIWQLFFGGTTEPPISAAEDWTASLGAAAILLLVGVGLWQLAGSGRRRTLLVIGPVAVTLTASALGLYPIAARIMVFAAPCLIIPVAAAAAALALRPRLLRIRGAAAFAGVVLVVPPLKRDLQLAAHPTTFEHVRPAVAELRKRALPTEPIYVFASSLPAWTFYTTDWSAPDRERLARVARLGGSGGPAFENAPPRDRRVGTENDSLVFALDGTWEIIGAAHGAQWRSGTGLVQYHPDPGWAAAEARRIRAAASPGVWLLVSHSYRLELFLYPELERLGGRLEYAYGKDGVVLRRYRFP